MPDGARCRLLHGRNLEDFGTEIAVISAFFKGGENLLKVQTAVARIPSVVICQVYVDIVGAVPADGLIDVLLLQIQMENIHHQPEIGAVHTVHHGSSLCQGIDEIRLHNSHCLQGNVHVPGCPVVSQLPEGLHCQVFGFFSGKFPAVLASHTSDVDIGSQKACKINDFPAPADSLLPDLLPGVCIA